MDVFGDLSSITDPVDFKNTRVPRLFEIDSLLRCHICKEFMTAPMLTHCGHSFCSVCIRKYIIHTPQCPICSKELRESNLHRNILIEQIIISYKDLRSDLVSELTNDVKTIQMTQKCKDTPDVIEIYENGDPSSRTSSMGPHEDDDDEDDVVIIEETSTKKRHFDPSSTGLDAYVKKPKTQKDLDTQLAQCPICQKMLPLELLQSTHIDSCLSNPQSPSSRPTTKSGDNNRSSRNTSSPSPQVSLFFQPKSNKNEYKKLTKLDYSSLSTSALKSKLSQLDLPNSGTRAQLETRYNEYLILWNANCDSIQPRDPRVLRKQLAQWENTVKSKVNSNESNLPKAEWDNLIKKAKKSLVKNEANTDNKGCSDIQEEIKEGENLSTEDTTTNEVNETKDERFFQ